MIKKKQKSTKTTGISKPVDVSPTTGLTPIQEQAAMLLASGESITAVADKLSLNRGTIYKWQKDVTYKCFFNRQCADNRSTLAMGLFGLAQEALTAVRDCLHSQNEQTRLKAAMWLTERLDNFSIGQTDVREAIKQDCTSSILDWDVKPDFNEIAYKEQLEVWGLDDE